MEGIVKPIGIDDEKSNRPIQGEIKMKDIVADIDEQEETYERNHEEASSKKRKHEEEPKDDQNQDRNKTKQNEQKELSSCVGTHDRQYCRP